jgi:cytochrome c oxidase cbb3-type subunit 3
VSKKKRELNQVLGHADEADGIEEYDNPLPDWWLGMLWLTIVWAVLYAGHYHFVGDRSQVKELAAEMAAAEEKWPQTMTATVFVATPELAEAGAAVYASSCAGCHGADAQGVIGPSLTDEVWIHGWNPAEVLAVITDGVPSKGMPSWGPILGPE